MPHELPDMPERVPTEDEVVRALRERGIEDLSAKEMLTRLTETFEAEANAENTSVASIRASNKVATILMKAGYFEAALVSLNENLEAAVCENSIAGADAYQETFMLIHEARQGQTSFEE